jgi:hypothetical protein
LQTTSTQTAEQHIRLQTTQTIAEKNAENAEKRRKAQKTAERRKTQKNAEKRRRTQKNAETRRNHTTHH